jgi:hypothetical protein
MVFLRPLVGSVSSRTALLGGPLALFTLSARAIAPSAAPFGEHAPSTLPKEQGFVQPWSAMSSERFPCAEFLCPAWSRLYRTGTIRCSYGVPPNIT